MALHEHLTLPVHRGKQVAPSVRDEQFDHIGQCANPVRALKLEAGFAAVIRLLFAWPVQVC